MRTSTEYQFPVLRIICCQDFAGKYKLPKPSSTFCWIQYPIVHHSGSSSSMADPSYLIGHWGRVRLSDNSSVPFILSLVFYQRSHCPGMQSERNTPTYGHEPCSLRVQPWEVCLRRANSILLALLQVTRAASRLSITFQ